MKFIILAALAMLSGCLTAPQGQEASEPQHVPPNPATPERGISGINEARIETHQLHVAGTQADLCLTQRHPGVLLIQSYFELNVQDNDTHLSLVATWTPINPTLENLHFKLQHRNDIVSEWTGTSPQRHEFAAKDLQDLGSLALWVDMEHCELGAAGATLSAPFVHEQMVNIEALWNQGAS